MPGFWPSGDGPGSRLQPDPILPKRWSPWQTRGGSGPTIPGTPGERRSVLLLHENRWVETTKGDRTCYAQIQDAGPGQYNDAEDVFGTDNERAKNTEFNSAGMDVSPAVNGCLGFGDINGEDDRVDWRFVDVIDVPPGPWRTLITTSQVTP